MKSLDFAKLKDRNMAVHSEKTLFHTVELQIEAEEREEKKERKKYNRKYQNERMS